MGSHDEGMGERLRTGAVGDTDYTTVQAELLRTRALLREVLEALLDDGWTFHRDSPVQQWWQEQLTKPRTEA